MKHKAFYYLFLSLRPRLSSTSFSTSAMACSKCISVDNVNANIRIMEYAVRGPLVIRAGEIEKELEKGVQKPFRNVIRANIGDAHAMGQVPITFIRQVVALCTYPSLIDKAGLGLPDDVKEKARRILAGCSGNSIGAYSASVGVEVVRKDVADFISQRDGFPADPANIVLSGGASESIRNLLKMFNHPTKDGLPPGVMIPIPQYPLYSASVAEFGMYKIGYYLDEENNWALNVSELKRAVDEARRHCNPRVLCVINPGNPTGQVLNLKNIEAIIKFAHQERLFLFADEVYQENVYDPSCKFHSFKKVICEMGKPYSEMELASFYSVSKGYMGECGMRGGYVELFNVDPEVQAIFNKSISAKLCSTVTGQAVMDCVVNCPKPGDASYESFIKEKTQQLQSLAERALMVEKAFNSIEGIKCNPLQGAMYAFPRVFLPQKAIDKAKSLNQQPDFFYAMQLLENSGICIVPGSGFGQIPGTYHFRTTILPPKSLLFEMVERFKQFHLKFMKDYS